VRVSRIVLEEFLISAGVSPGLGISILVVRETVLRGEETAKKNRGMERRKIFLDAQDRDNFLDRLGDVLRDRGTIRCPLFQLAV
jgi:hypothetical protein